MTQKMLINAARAEEVRAATVRDGVLENLEYETRVAHLIKGNVYKGVVANVEASLNACFVEIGVHRQGFLSMDDIAPACYHDKPRGEGKPRINEVIRRGREIVVQVTRDAMGSKGPALTTHCSLAGRFMVLMPYDGTVGISRKLEDEANRKALKATIAKLTVPDGTGFIIRTAGVNQTKTALNRDLSGLLKLWKRIKTDALKVKGPALLYEEGDLVVRMIRDYYSSDFDAIVVDTEEAMARARSYFRAVMPRTKANFVLHEDREPLFSRYRIEDQIETIHSRRVRLPSGGNIVIDPTEALTAIDVNSAKATREKSQEETALKTNLESATEIARQLRLRDLGGLLVVDFIDMSARKHNRMVEKAVREGVKQDKARVYLGRISDNGLMEINRQRIKAALRLRTHRDCPTCSGTGSIPAVEFTAMQVLRRIDARASSGTLLSVQVDLHPELADELQNQYRRELADLESDNDIQIRIVGRPGLPRTEQQLSFKERGGSRRKGQGRKGNEGKGRGKGNQGRGKGGSRNGGKAQAPPSQRAQAAAPARAKPRDKGPDRGTRKPSEPRAGAAETPDRPSPPPQDTLPLTKSQKRRRRRKRKAERDRLMASGLSEDEAEATLLAAEADAPSPAAVGSDRHADDTPAGSNQPRKKRSRSRGRRRGRSDDKGSPEQQALKLAESSDEAPADADSSRPEAADDAADSGSKRSRRSRSSRGRSRGRRGASRGKAGEESSAEAPPESEPMTPAASEPEES